MTNRPSSISAATVCAEISATPRSAMTACLMVSLLVISIAIRGWIPAVANSHSVSIRVPEANYLHRAENERDYGQEAIEILLQVMEDKRDDLVVILAGYGDRMASFFGSNPGFRSRVAHHIEFPDYSNDELVAIGEYLALRRDQPLFANARSVRNALDRARLRQANRHLAAGVVRVDDLSIIEGSDIRASRVFQSTTAEA